MLTIQFSRAAPPTLREKWRQKSPIDYSLWICRLTHSPFSHADCVLSDGNLLGASDDPYAPVIKGNPRGVAIRPDPYQREAVSRRAFIACPEDILEKFNDFCFEQVGKPFDGSALKLRTFLSPEFNRDWRNDATWYCAELIARAAEVSGLLATPILAVKNRITAADLLLIVAPLMINAKEWQ
jgi:hypothetical protein